MGHIVSGDGVLADFKKIEIVMYRFVPKSLSEIQSFLGMAGY